MKTVTLWNVPIEVAEIAIEAMKNRIVYLAEHERYDEVEDCIYHLRNIEEDYRKAVEED